MTHRRIARILGLAAVFVLGAIGCGQKPQQAKDKPTECSYVLPQLQKNIVDYVEYTGRTAARDSVDVKARVTGFLLPPKLFEEGKPVTKDQPLFLIDPKPYDAQLKQAEAQIDLYKAQLELNSKTFEQKQETRKKNPDAITELDLRTTEAQMKQSQAALDAAKASLEIYQLNKNYTTVTAPIDGVVGRRNQSPGNLIIQDQTLLTTVVSLDKMYVYFDMDAPTYAQFHPDKDKEATKAPISLEPPVAASAAALVSPISGEVDFFNNQFNPATDTLLVRGIFDNPAKPQVGSRLRPGMFVRVKVTIGEPYEALVVPDQAILSKMGKKYVYVADQNNRVKELPVVIGQLKDQGLRVIRREQDPATGQFKPGQLSGTDRVIVSRLLDLHPNQEIVAVPQTPSAPPSSAPTPSTPTPPTSK
jgi:multidrug efflux system membrane fusion protein